MNLFMESNELEHFVYCSEYININSVVGQGVGTSLKNPQTMETVAKKVGYSSQADYNILWVRTKPTQLIESGEVELVPPWSITPMFKYLSCSKVLDRLLKEKPKHHPTTKPLTKSLSSARYARRMTAYNWKM